jgi:eukaryotic-like serine/threonine-protein kinase
VAGTGPNVYTTRADGSTPNAEPLRAEGLSAAPAVWSQGGELVFFLARDGDPDILATPAAAVGEVREVAVTDDAEFDPALSPDGHWLAYASNRTGQVEIWVKGYPDGVPVRVSRSGGYEPLWSADGRELFFLQGSSMMAVAVETEPDFSFGAPVQLFNRPYFTAPNPGARSYAVARDGRFLMIQPDGAASNAAPASIVVVENWTEELKRRVPTGNQ